MFPESVNLNPDQRHFNSTLCKLCEIEDFDDAEFSALAGEIMANDPSRAIKHRKLWEFTKLVQALQRFDLLNDSASGLSVAAGSERVLYYLANRIGRIVATDIYGSGEFSEREAKLDFLSQPEAFAPYPYRRTHLKALSMDALKLMFPSNLFNFAFSLSSIEHFGSLSASIAAIREMARVVRPGGLVIVTTECALNGFRSHDVFQPQELLTLVNRSGLTLVEPFNWSYRFSDAASIIDLRRDDLQRVPHILLKSFGSIFTSICLVLQKPKVQNSSCTDLEQLDALIEQLQIEAANVTYDLATTSWCYQLKRKLSGICYRLMERLFFESPKSSHSSNLIFKGTRYV